MTMIKNMEIDGSREVMGGGIKFHSFSIFLM